jgi:hypothetical protein
MPSQDFNEGFRVPFRQYIIDDLAINSLIDNRFYGAQLATLDLTASSFPIAVFYPDAGSPYNLSIIKKFRVVIRCYSENSFDESYAIYKLICERLGGENGPVTIPDTGITVRPVTLPNETYENEPRLYGVGSRFLVHWIS